MQQGGKRRGSEIGESGEDDCCEGDCCVDGLGVHWDSGFVSKGCGMTVNDVSENWVGMSGRIGVRELRRSFLVERSSGRVDLVVSGL